MKTVQRQVQFEQVSAKSSQSDEPVILCAADDLYVRPLAVTLYSAAKSLKAGNHLRVMLIDGGVSESNWNGLKETLIGLPISIEVVSPDPSVVADLAVSHHITRTAYYRLLAARLLPDSLDKLIYLDSDVLVRQDITELWDLDVGDHYCLAAIDIACPFIDARQAEVEFKRAIPYLAAIAPVQNWLQLGLDGGSPYFNSGVMVINLKRWREERVEQALLACLRDNPKHVWCWDQYALNVVFAGQWQPLPAKWNQGAHVFEYPDPSYSPIDRDEFVQMRDDPALIHFTTEYKPWKFRSFHPLRETWYAALDQTAWANWRPEKPPFSLHDWWTVQVVGWIRRWTINYRKLKYLTVATGSTGNLVAENECRRP